MSLANAHVPTFCEPCFGAGMVMNKQGHLAICLTCQGTGRRLRHAYEPGAGEQGDTFGDLKPTTATPPAHADGEKEST